VVNIPAKSINYGEYAFLGGIALAVILGLLASILPVELLPVLVAVLFLLGLVVGLVNITEKETTAFLIAAIALLTVAGSWGQLIAVTLGTLGTVGLGGIGSSATTAIVGVTSMLLAFVSPAAFVVAIKAIYNLASPD
jgi:hypothetical protein